MNHTSAWATDIGLKRQKNQDSGFASDEMGLYIVADGMGGHQGGEIASQMAIDTMTAAMQGVVGPNSEFEKAIAALKESIHRANHLIFERSLRENNLTGMGTTTTALLCSQQQAALAHVGDSRAYLIRPGQIWQLTRDHSLVQEKLRAGLITREQVKSDSTKNVITRSVGFGQDTEVDIYLLDLCPGDLILICSDGLSGQLDDMEILEVTQKRAGHTPDDLKETVQDLISWANGRGGFDNTTAILMKAR